MPATTPRPRLQSRPPFRLAIGELPKHEQSHVQIALRVISPRLAVPCHIIDNDEHADFALKPTEHGAGLILSSKSRQITLERPIRIAPLADALSALVDENIATNEYPPQHAETSAPDILTEEAGHQSSTSLLATLLENKTPCAQEITLDNGMTLLIDERQHCVHSTLAPADLFKAIGGARVACTQALASEEFLSHRDGRHAIQLEQLCWACTADYPHESTQLGHWQQAPDASIQLQSWPNLSWQPDATAWLNAFARLSRHPMKLLAFIAATQSEGIDSKRAHHGLSMLLAFRHAKMIEPGTTPGLLYRSPAYTRPARPRSFLDRLREQLRTITK